MSSSDRIERGAVRRLRLPALVATLALALAACTAQPLYGPTPGGQAVTTALDRITIDEVDDRVAQQVRNNLLFNLNSHTGSQPAYRMRLTTTTAEHPLGVTPVESAPAYSVTVTVTFTVTALADDKVVLRETRRASASYDRVNQVFSNVRARRDAENRAAEAVANDIRIRLAAAAAQGIL